MNSKQFLSGVCALALVAGLSGCGKAGDPPSGAGTPPSVTEAAASEAPVSQDTLLAMELVENYLAMEKPQHESIQTRLGLLTSELEYPIVSYEDWSYTAEGQTALIDFSPMVTVLDSGSYLSPGLEDQVIDNFWMYYLYPEVTQWMPRDPRGHYEDWLDGVHFYFQNPRGEDTDHYGHGELGYNPAAENMPAWYGFASLPKKSYRSFLQEAVRDGQKAQQLFTLTDCKMYDMEQKQELYRKKVDLDVENQFSAEAVLNNYHYMTMGKRPCYAVSCDIPQEYLGVFRSGMMDRIFNQEALFESPVLEGQKELSYEEYMQIHNPVKSRLSPGMVHVSLYFDKDTKACIGQKLDLTDCAGAIMDQLCALDHVKAGDRSFVIETQFFDNTFEGLPASLKPHVLEKEKPNQAVFYIGEDQCKPEMPEMLEMPADFVQDGNPFTLNRYESSFDEEFYLHRITENGELAGLMEIFDKDAVLDVPEDPYDPNPAPEDYIRYEGEGIKDFYLKERGMDPQECKTPNGISYAFCKNMKISPPTDWNPDTVCMGIFRDEKAGTLCILYSDDRDKIESILEDLSWHEISALSELPTVPEMPEETLPAAEPHHQIFSLEHYGLSLNQKTGLYEITDETGVIGTFQKCDYCPELDQLVPEECTSGKGLAYRLYEVPMGKLFGVQDCTPEETGYMASFREKGTSTGFLLSVWERETAEKIMEDLSMTTEVMPNFWEIRGTEPNLMMP